MVQECNGVEIEFYDTPQKLPIKRYQRFIKYFMIDKEVGNSFQDYDMRTLKTIEFLRKEMLSEAIKEMDNRRQCIFNAFEEYSPKHKSLAILVKRIGDVVYDDYSDKSLDEIIDRLNGIGYSTEETDKAVSEVKKKSKRNWLNIIRTILGRPNKYSIMASGRRSSQEKLSTF